MPFKTILFLILLAAEREPPAAAGKLIWVNPARCLSPCAYRPDALERLNDAGVPDAAGRHRLTPETAAALRGLFGAARSAGHGLRIRSAFRSYGDQASVAGKYRNQPGGVARPGHSEHQLGTAVDLTIPSGSALAWLTRHAAEHGFTSSYPPHKQRRTGYRSEAWHFRHVGRDLAAELKRRGQILEEYFRENPEAGVSGLCGDCPLPASRASCGQETAAGRCQGGVLSWCYDGVPVSVDCSVSEDICRRQSGQATCVSR